MKSLFPIMAATVGLGTLLSGCATHHYVTTTPPPVVVTTPTVVVQNGPLAWVGQYGYDYRHRPLDQFGYPVDPYTGIRVGTVVITRVYYPTTTGSWATSRPTNYVRTYTTYRPTFTRSTNLPNSGIPSSGNRPMTGMPTSGLNNRGMPQSNMGNRGMRSLNPAPGGPSSFNKSGGFNTNGAPTQPSTQPTGRSFNRSGGMNTGGASGTPTTTSGRSNTSSFQGTPSTGGTSGARKNRSSFGPQ